MDLLATDWVTAGECVCVAEREAWSQLRVAGAFAHPAFLDEGHFERIERASSCLQDIRNLLDAVLLATTLQGRC